MTEIRFHGRGGQGAVTAATILAIAGFKDGKFTQAFPRFGVERRGAPVEAFTRMDDKFIRRKSAVYEPDILVVLDSTLFGIPASSGKESGATPGPMILEGLKEGGTVIINTNKDPESFGIHNTKVKTVDVTALAMEVLGRDIVNTAMLGAFAGFTGMVSVDGITDGINEHFSGSIAAKNVDLVKKVYKEAKKNG
ncbi:MAG: pyruvate ferredoxin oxidoreductase subunit gamma [Methanobacteriota archaeon]